MPDLTHEFVGQEQLVPAIDIVSQTDGPDLVVVRDFLQDEALLNRLQDMDADYDAVWRDVHQAVPSLYDAGEFVEQRWRQIGYAGMSASPEMFLDQLRPEGIEPHIDDALMGETQVNAIVQGSLCLAGVRKFCAERLPETFYRQGGEHAGEFDLQRFNAFFDPLELVLKQSRQPRSSVVLRPGDLALFAHHPAVVLHSAEHLTPVASGRLLSWIAERDNR